MKSLAGIPEFDSIVGRRLPFDSNVESTNDAVRQKVPLE